MNVSDKTLTGILIDPIKRSVAKVQVQPKGDGGYQIAEQLGCDWIEHVIIGRHPHQTDTGIDLWVDEEGLLVQPNPRGYFRLIGGSPTGNYVFGGRGLVLGFDGEGNATSIPPTMTADRMHGFVEFVAFDDLAPDSEALNPKMTVTSYNADGSVATESTHPIHVTRTDHPEQ